MSTSEHFSLKQDDLANVPTDINSAGHDGVT
jgi:hypothetical protein